jgi:hypothetical protein
MRGEPKVCASVSTHFRSISVLVWLQELVPGANDEGVQGSRGRDWKSEASDIFFIAVCLEALPLKKRLT